MHIFIVFLLVLFLTYLSVLKLYPFIKKSNRADYNNYRPISIVPIVSKVFEFLLNKQIMFYFEQNTLFPDRKFGFRYGCSTSDAVTALINNFFGELENVILFRANF